MFFILRSFIVIILLSTSILGSYRRWIVENLPSADEFDDLRKVCELIRLDKTLTILKTTIVCDRDSTDQCEMIVKLISAELAMPVTVFDSEYYVINLFSTINILCFHSSSKFFAFAFRINLSWPVLDSYYLMAIRENRFLVDASQADLLLRTLWTSFNIYRVLIFGFDRKVRVYRVNVNRTQILNTERIKSLKSIFRVTDFKGRPLRITLFPRIPEVVSLENGQCTGYGYNLMTTLSRKLNFTPVILDSSDGSRFGGYANGSYFGGLGDVSYGRSDIGMNGYFVRDNAAEFLYLYSFNVDNFCVVVPKAGKLPKYLIPFKSFPTAVWTALAIVFASTYWFQTIIKIFDLKFIDSARKLTGSTFLTTLSATLNFPLPSSRYRYLKCRIILVTYLSFMYVMVSSFQASLVTLLSIPNRYRDIDTWEELSSSTLDIRTASSSIKRIFVEDSTWHEVGRRLKVAKPNETDNLDFAFFTRIAHTHRRYVHDFVIKKGNRTYEVHTMSECPLTYYTSHVVSKKFPFVNEFDSIIKRVIEAGLIKKWDSDSNYALDSDYVVPKNVTPKIRQLGHYPQPLSLEDIEIAFVILVVGNMCGILAFALETFLLRRKNDNKIGKIRRNLLGR